ncbi:hypothetical protein pipiens_012213 [Culex pipiens pipiens]|uniref:Uncharacterized protein n=1 Tax=Culex pipiens pipiens TaxID=38569 RepID=A0ABD1D394_CULPP
MERKQVAARELQELDQKLKSKKDEDGRLGSSPVKPVHEDQQNELPPRGWYVDTAEAIHDLAFREKNPWQKCQCQHRPQLEWNRVAIVTTLIAKISSPETSKLATTSSLHNSTSTTRAKPKIPPLGGSQPPSPSQQNGHAGVGGRGLDAKAKERLKLIREEYQRREMEHKQAAARIEVLEA